MTRRVMLGISRRSCLVWLMPLAVAGCTTLTDPGRSFFPRLSSDEQAGIALSASEGGTPRIANPKARQIRFDGHETVLGDGQQESLTGSELLELVEPLLSGQRYRSASLTILRHPQTAERLLLERWSESGGSAALRMMADVLSWRDHRQAAVNWNSLVAQSADSRSPIAVYFELRRQFASQLQTEEPTAEEVAALQAAANRAGHPILLVDCWRLVGLHQLLAERPQEAWLAFSRGREAAATHGDVAAASRLQLLLCEAARRSNQPVEAEQMWRHAIHSQINLTIERDSPLDVHFWLRAERLKPARADWPAEVGVLCGRLAADLGCRQTAAAAPSGEPIALNTAFWAALGASQLQRNQPQLALVSLKRAEQSASSEDQPWLRIAQARCLAGLGQSSAAVALLSVPMASEDPSLQAAATTTLASLKIQNGAYAQGASLLHRTLQQHASIQWPGRLNAEADLALARLILGRTGPGLEALHRVQQAFHEAGDWEGLIRSLENERNLLDHEKRTGEAKEVMRRLLEIERI